MGTLTKVHKRYKGVDNRNAGATGWHSKSIQAALSTQIIVQTEDALGLFNTVGAIQTLAPTETRPLVRISELGTDGVLQIVPSAAFTVELAVTRLVFDYRRLPAAFSRGFRHIHAQRIPFDIKVLDYNRYAENESVRSTRNPILADAETPATNDYARVEVFKSPLALKEDQIKTDNVITTRYVNCWLTSYSYTYDQSNYLITENATIWAETVIEENTKPPLDILTADNIEAFFNDSLESNAMATAFIGGRVPRGG